MKTVFNNSMVAHVWAQRSQDEGRSANSSFYFEGDTIYSYGSHFPIAKFIELDGETVVMFTTRSYSNSTSNHINHASGACSHYKRIDCYNPLADLKELHEENYKEIIDQIEPTKKLYVRARQRKEMYVRDMQKLIDRANEYTKLFKLGYKQITLDIDEEQIKKDLAVQAAKDKKAKAKRLAKELKENAEKIEQWLNGVGNYCPRLDSALLRVRTADEWCDIKKHAIKVDIVETSWGAHFPVSDCRKVWDVITKCKNEKRTFTTNGTRHNVGQFNIDHVSELGNVRAGCHLVKYEAIERIALELGYIEEAIAA